MGAYFTGIQKVWFYYDSRLALPVQLMFWGNMLSLLLRCSGQVLPIRKKTKECVLTGLLICSVLNAFSAASVAFLERKYYLHLGVGTLNQYLLFVLVNLLFFICALIYLTSGLIMAWKEASRNTGTMRNLFSFSDRSSQN